MRERQEDYVQWEKRYKGLCRNEYYVGTPATRTITESYREITYKLEPEKIKVGAIITYAYEIFAAAHRKDCRTKA